MILLLLAALGATPDYCAWHEPAARFPMLSHDERGDTWKIHRRYGALWARCALDRGAKPPVLLVVAREGGDRRVLLEKTIELRPSLDPESIAEISETFRPCDRDPPNRRARGAVLEGPTGRRRWKNPRTIEVELVAQGPLAPLSFKARAEALCDACVTEKGTASISNYVREKNETRFYVSVPKERFACARGGGRMILRRYWADAGTKEWSPLVPDDVVDNLEEKLRPKEETMFFESLAPASRFCRPGKTYIWEVIGIDEYSTIVNRSSYGPSAHIRRAEIEFLKCK